MSAARHHHSHGALTASAALASVATALLLLVLKSYAAWETGSVSMLGSLADTGLDFIASLVTFLGVRIAATPADQDHRFGHGKAEALVALFQIALITASAIAIAWRAGTRLSTDQVAVAPELGIAVSVAALAITLILLAYQRSIIRRTGSIAIRADHLHYQSDLLLNGTVIVALVLETSFGIVGADPVLGLLIAAWLIWGAGRGASLAVDQLMDKEWPLEKRRRFALAAGDHPASRGIHDLRTRTSGNRDFAQFHIWLDPAMSVEGAHDVMDEIEEKLVHDFPGVEILIHPDPEGHEDRVGNLPAELTERRES